MTALSSGDIRNAYLQTYLAPLAPLLQRREVTDIFVNRAGEAWAELLGGQFEQHLIPALDETHLTRLARQIAAYAHQGVNRNRPLVSATLPDGARVQVIGPPATRAGLALAVRKHVLADMRLEDLDALGGLSPATPAARPRRDAALSSLLAQGEIVTLLKEIVRQRLNVVVCGGTSSGKTTFTNALIKEIPVTERLIVIEDAPELRFAQPNALGLVAVRGDQGEARVTVEDLLQASLRMRPDRIIIGELRGLETLSFVRATSSGHPGSITTVHADDSTSALRHMTLMMMQANPNLTPADAEGFLRRAVDVWIQLERRDGLRVVAEIVLEPGESRPPTKRASRTKSGAATSN